MRGKDLTNKRFGKLVALRRAGSNKQGCVMWICQCDCGNEKPVSSDHLTRKSYPVKSCGCGAQRKGSEHKQWTGHGEISGGWWYNHVTRDRGSRKELEVSVTIEQAWSLFLRQERRCALSGVQLTIHNDRKINTASIDRIDSSRGYELDNIQWVHKDINFMKRTYGQEYFIEMCKHVARTQGQQ